MYNVLILYDAVVGDGETVVLNGGVMNGNEVGEGMGLVGGVGLGESRNGSNESTQSLVAGELSLTSHNGTINSSTSILHTLPRQTAVQVRS